MRTTTLDNGNVRSSYALRLDSGKTRRSEKPALHLSLDSEENAKAGSESDRIVRPIAELLEAEGEMTTAAIVAADLAPERTVTRALKQGHNTGAFRRPAHGRYKPN